MGYPREGTAEEYLIHCGQHASFLHAGGLSCYCPHPKDGECTVFSLFVSSHLEGYIHLPMGDTLSSDRGTLSTDGGTHLLTWGSSIS